MPYFNLKGIQLSFLHRSVAFIESSRSDLGAGQYFSLVFLVSGASYKASYKTSSASVLYDFAFKVR